MPELVRLNEKSQRSSPYINFITALPNKRSDEALALLNTISAQFKSLMKAEGLVVNRFSEVEYNGEFAGRNFNAGELIEIVLVRKDGYFYPYSWLLAVMAHELAHIRQMNHSPAFQKVNANFKSRVMDSYRHGKTGDGFWGKGMNLSGRDIAPLLPSDYPHFLCKGKGAAAAAAQQRRLLRRRESRAARSRGSMGEATVTTGRQTAIVRKPGGAVTRKGAFPDSEGYKLDANESSFRKRANAKSAKEVRADLAERRIAEAKKAARREQQVAADAGAGVVEKEPKGIVDGAIVKVAAKKVGGGVGEEKGDEKGKGKGRAIDIALGDATDDSDMEGSSDDEDSDDDLEIIEEDRYLKHELATWDDDAPDPIRVCAIDDEEDDSDIEIIEMPPRVKEVVSNKDKRPVTASRDSLHKKRVAPIASGSGSGMWRCGSCTLHNESKDKRCIVCDAARPV